MLTIDQLAAIYHAKYMQPAGGTRAAKRLLGQYLDYQTGSAKAAELDAVLEEIETHSQLGEIKRLAGQIDSSDSERCRQRDHYLANWKRKWLHRDFVSRLLSRFKPDQTQEILQIIEENET